MKKINKPIMLAVCLMAPLLSSCAATGQGNECAAFIPVYIAKADQLTDGTARQILQNNRTGKELCGWKPSN